MQFSTSSFAALAAALALALAPQAARAGLTTFSTFTCGGTVGPDVPCDGTCHSFVGQHSFSVDVGTGDHCVTAFIDAGCPNGGEGFTFPNEDTSCQSVDTGTAIRSFICAPGNICLV